MATDDFYFFSEPELDIICDIISLLPFKYDTITEVIEEEGNGLAEELEKHKPL